MIDCECAWRSDRRIGEESVKKYRSRRGEGGREAGSEAGSEAEGEGGEQAHEARSRGKDHEATSWAEISRGGATGRGAASAVRRKKRHLADEEAE